MPHPHQRTLALVAACLPLAALGCSRGGSRPATFQPAALNSIEFLGRTDIPIGNQATAVGTDDVDGDGVLDVVVGQFNDAQVSVMLGLGNGSYASGSGLPPSALQAFTFALGDLDGDHLVDIVVSDLATHRISVYRNVGAGHFSVQPWVPTSNNVFGLAIADMDGDGTPDIVAASFSSMEIRVHRGLGGFVFDAGTAFPVVATPARLTTALLDGDSLPDLVFTDIDGNHVYRWKNTSTPGAMSFAEWGSAETEKKPYGIALVNVDGDPDLEIAVATTGYPAIAIWKQDASGLVPFGSIPLPGLPMGLAFGDVNGDGALDAVATLFLDDAIAVALGHGDGTFAPAIVRATGRIPVDLSVADGNGDGYADVYVTGAASGQLSVFTGGPGEIAGPATLYPGYAPYCASYGDLDGDGLPELLFADAAVNELRIFANQGSLSFALAATLPVGGLPSIPVVLDVDKDGRLDIAQLHTQGLTLFHNDGGFHFTAEPTIAVGVGLCDGIAVDLDKDHDLDVVASSPGTASLRVFRAKKGSLEPWATVAAGAGAGLVAAGDVDHDGRIDLVNTNMAADTVSIARRLPNGGWAGNAAVLPTGSTPTYVRLADLDGDKLPELVIAHRHSPDIYVYRNEGHLAFTGSTIPAAGLAQTLFVRDLNLDGEADLLYSENLTGRVFMRLGNGDGTFGPITLSFPTQYVLSTPILADLDGDGRPEFVANSDQTGLVTIHRNLSH